MSIIPDELKTQTFPCPNCRQIISSEVDVCRYCSANIASELKNASIQKELNERRNARIRNHKIYMGFGAVAFLIGIFGIVSPVLGSYMNSPSVNLSCWTPILLVGGLVGIVKGFSGYRLETRQV